MSKEILFVRHGESTVNQTKTISNRVSDYAPLTELGRQQAKELLDKIKDRRIIAVISSPLRRARETAEIIANEFGIKVEVNDALREPDCGEIEGRSDGEAWEMHKAQEDAWRKGNIDYRIQGGESFREVRDRFIPFIKEMLSKYKDNPESIIFVSHGSMLINMLPLLLTNIDSDFTHTTPLQNCSYVLVGYSDSDLKCLEWDGKLIPQK